MKKSTCCNTETKIGIYDMTQRPDIHGRFVSSLTQAVPVIGTYCTKCDKLCDYKDIEEDITYFTNGQVKWTKLY
jgi:hypothetical protein